MDSFSIVKEDLLQYVWRTKQLSLDELFTTDGEKVDIFHFGYLNSHAGPDFSQAKIKINDTLWVGNVEMHVLSSMWNTHGHNNDPAYDNVILHVVYEEDKEICRKDRSKIPCIELKDRILPKIKSNYGKLLQNDYWVPCEKLINLVPQEKIQFWWHHLLVDRLERKTNDIKDILAINRGDWEETTFVLISKYLGGKVNSLPMELLARSIPVTTLYKNRNNLLTVEALLFGQSGMIQSAFKDEYPSKLKKEYSFYQKKYSLQPINPVAWKFGKMRPANFPTIRIAQLADLLYQQEFLFRKIIEAHDGLTIKSIFAAEASFYWNNHYRFDKESKSRVKKLGDGFIDMLSINVVAPLLFTYGMMTGEEKYKNKALHLLQEIPPEKNNIISRWKSLSVTPKNAYDSQSLIQLKQQFCRHQKCLHCAIGNHIMKS